MSLAIWALATAGSALVLTQSTIAKPLREWLSDESGQRRLDGAIQQYLEHGGKLRPYRAYVRTWTQPLAKLVNCPMCSGFWLGLAWAVILGARGVLALAHAFGGSIVSALAVAAWILLQEAHQAFALWRYNNPPRRE